jgi:hypothetical protein
MSRYLPKAIENESEHSKVPEAQSPANAADWSRDLIEAIAKDVGDAVVAHVTMMYPAAIEATPSTFRLSLRNTVINEILASIKTSDADAIVRRLAERKKTRRSSTTAYRKMRAGAKT